MTTQMIVRIDSEIKDKVTKIAKAEGKNTSQVVRELLEKYIQERDISTYVDDLWNRVGGKLRVAGDTPESVERAIQEVRRRKG